MAEEVILGFLKENDEIADSGEFAASVAVDHDNLINVIKSLNGLRIVDAQDIKREKWVLTDEGKSYTVSGSPEVQFFHAVPPEGIFQDELQKKIDSSVYKIGCAQAMRNKWVQTQKLQEMGKIQVSRKVQHVEDSVKDLLLSIKDGKEIGPADVDVLKKRKLIALQTWKGYSLRKGPNYVTKRTKPVTDLTREHLQRFWNFDALFQPQQHPARDSHDTFFLQVPSTTKRLPEDYVDRVKRVHESGGYGSKGYGYEWKRDEANKNLLRTHTTSVLSRMLYLLAQLQEILLHRCVFRNEAVDRTHLAEFHQIEGLICDHGLTLGDLIGVLNEFFSRLGFNKWVEVGNSGMFRPEMLLPMGLPEDVRVIAWGLSLERPTMILYGIDNIRDLFGHKVDLGLIKTNPICRLGIQ